MHLKSLLPMFVEQKEIPTFYCYYQLSARHISYFTLQTKNKLSFL